MTATYDKLGLRFLYPENWRITDERLDQWPRTVSVQSPSSAFWSLHLYTRDTEPSRIAEEVLLAMRQEYEDLEAAPVREQIGPTDAIGYDMDFYCLDFVVTSQSRTFTHGEHTYLLIFQAEDREFAQLESVFRAMTISLLSADNRGPGDTGEP